MGDGHDCSVSEAVNDRDGMVIGRLQTDGLGVKSPELANARKIGRVLETLEAWRRELARRLV